MRDESMTSYSSYLIDVSEIPLGDLGDLADSAIVTALRDVLDDAQPMNDFAGFTSRI